MTTKELTLAPNVDARLDDLAQRHNKASSGGMEIITRLGTHAEGWLDRLPAPVRDGLDGATRAALSRAVKVAQASRTAVPDQPGWVNSVVGAAMGAAGGLGGAPTALAELPVTTTLLLRVIQGVAAEHGFDPAEENVQFDCLTVFGSAGPMANDDGSDTAFLSARIGLSGAALNKIIHAVAPKLAAAMGQKLAAQSVPLLGAAAGAAINYSFTSYYREMAYVHFGLRQLAIEADVPEAVLTRALQHKIAGVPVNLAARPPV
ncbi:MAG: EcsC family protein [Aliishimia sp.]